MKQLAIVFGLILIGIGVTGFALPGKSVKSAEVNDNAAADAGVSEQTSSKRSITALIPAFVGIIIAGCGWLATVKPDVTKHAMHGAAGIALLGAIAATGRGVPSLFKYFSDSASVNGRVLLFLMLMAIICWTYVVLSILSFRAARMAGEAKSGD